MPRIRANEATDPWGIKVANVEIKDVDLNDTMVRAIARQAGSTAPPYKSNNERSIPR